MFVVYISEECKYKPNEINPRMAWYYRCMRVPLYFEIIDRRAYFIPRGRGTVEVPAPVN